MVRALQRSILGSWIDVSFFSTSRQRTPRVPRSSARVSPTGPAPTMRTCVSITRFSVIQQAGVVRPARLHPEGLLLLELQLLAPHPARRPDQRRPQRQLRLVLEPDRVDHGALDAVG